MKTVFYAPDGAGDKLLVAAVMGGAQRHGDEVLYVPTFGYEGVLADADAAACYGVRASSRIILDAYRRAGKRTLFFDKAYFGRGRYCRVAVDAWQPTAYFRCGRDASRFERSELKLSPARNMKADDQVIYAATTQTWCDFYDLGPSRSLDEVIVRLLDRTQFNVVYRPRPAYAKKHPEFCGPIDGVPVSDPDMPLSVALAHARMLVTLGSNAAVEALAAGVPTVVLGDNPCAVMNGSPMFAGQREQFFADLAWCQWQLDEYLSGDAWSYVKETMARTAQA